MVGKDTAHCLEADQAFYIYQDDSSKENFGMYAAFWLGTGDLSNVTILWITFSSFPYLSGSYFYLLVFQTPFSWRSKFAKNVLESVTPLQSTVVFYCLSAILYGYICGLFYLFWGSKMALNWVRQLHFHHYVFWLRLPIGRPGTGIVGAAG